MASPIEILRAFIQAVSDGGGMDYQPPEMFNPAPQSSPSAVDDLFNQGQLGSISKSSHSRPEPMVTPTPRPASSSTSGPSPQSSPGSVDDLFNQGQLDSLFSSNRSIPKSEFIPEQLIPVKRLFSGSRATPEDTFIAKGNAVEKESGTSFSKGSFSKSNSNKASENYGFVDAKSLIDAGIPAGLAATIANQANDQKRKTGSSELSAILRQLLGSESQVAIQRPGTFGDQDKARLNLLANILQGQPMSKELIDILALATGMKDLSVLAEGLPSLKRRQ